MRATGFLFCLVPALGLSPAWATCPTAADLGTGGITLVQNDPTFRRSDYEVAAEGLTEVRLYEQEGRTLQRVVTYAHGLAPTTETRPEGLVQISYAGDVAALDRIDREGAVVLDAKWLGPVRRLADLQIAYRFAEAREMVIQTCAYRVFDIEEVWVLDGDDIVRRTVAFAPDLGLILSAHDKEETGEDFAYSWIGTAADIAR
ncbi:hypothetical protein [Maritimibacter sp. DP1N21-5]|uniref:hypothetical protein n=1 Tax=Maritimibacter sp. DP1N21-5 TaxID=2836867 RepID=UPI001C47D68C|nr:hypothetical protein [Maritimibacter sp. DP1N21-5]MBV7409101.1 hypothetical protein [Maritimibacter sp. DP1N21-5]